MTTQDKLETARAALAKLNGDKDKYLAAHKSKARAARDKVTAFAAELVAEQAVAEMSEAEQQAIGVQLTKVGS